MTFCISPVPTHPRPLEPAQHPAQNWTQHVAPNWASLRGTRAQLPQGWMLSISDGQHPACTGIPGVARPAGCSQRCRFSSQGAGQEGFVAPQDRARSEAAPALGGQQSSGHGQPEGHGQDCISRLLHPPSQGTFTERLSRVAGLPAITIPSASPMAKGRGWPRQGSRSSTAGPECSCPMQAGVPGSLAQVGRG